MADTLAPRRKNCSNCPPLVVPRRGYTPTRPSCIECVEKHLGAAMVLLGELNDMPDEEPIRSGNFSRRLRAIGHLFEAEDESQEWPQLHQAIRSARKSYQANGELPIWALLAAMVHGNRD